MKAWIAILVIINLCFANSEDEDEILDAIRSFGYEANFDSVITEDGYILGVHHLHPKPQQNEIQKFPVLLMHGFLTTPISFFVAHKKKALPFMLADRGYDVFMGSRRGTTFSSEHRNLSSDSKEYWDFSWHSIGLYDLAAFVDYTLDSTNKTKCFYVGYSQANVELLVLLSSRAEYNEKIIQAHMMSSAAALPNIHELGHFLSPLMLNYAKLHDDFLYLNMKAFIPFQVEFANLLCNSLIPLRVEICKNVIFFMVGRNRRSTEVNPSLYVSMFKNLSPRVGFKQILHFAQVIVAGQFQTYDHGIEKNLIAYNSTEPPEYDLDEVIAPTFIYAGEEDVVFHPKVILLHFSNFVC